MFGLGIGELIIILVIVVLLFGARKLPELGKSLGSGIREFRRGSKDEAAEADEKLHQTPRPGDRA